MFANAFTAVVWLHELLHIDWVSHAAPYGKNAHIQDLSHKIRNIKDSVRALGPKWAKAIARYQGENVAQYIWANAENTALYAMVMYVQSALEVYPHLPWASEPPEYIKEETCKYGMLNDYDGAGIISRVNCLTAGLSARINASPRFGICGSSQTIHFRTTISNGSTREVESFEVNQLVGAPDGKNIRLIMYPRAIAIGDSIVKGFLRIREGR